MTEVHMQVFLFYKVDIIHTSCADVLNITVGFDFSEWTFEFPWMKFLQIEHQLLKCCCLIFCLPRIRNVFLNFHVWAWFELDIWILIFEDRLLSRFRFNMPLGIWGLEWWLSFFCDNKTFEIRCSNSVVDICLCNRILQIWYWCSASDWYEINRSGHEPPTSCLWVIHIFMCFLYATTNCSKACLLTSLIWMLTVI